MSFISDGKMELELFGWIYIVLVDDHIILVRET
jgi:hypothetical protein